MKVVIALAALAVFVVGCSAKADEGDAEVKLAPGTAKAPSATTPGGGGGGGGPAGGPKAKMTAPTAPK